MLTGSKWWLIEAVGRRKLFISMALGTMAVLIGEAICVQIDTYSSGIGAVFFIFLFEGCGKCNPRHSSPPHLEHDLIKSIY